MITRVVKMTFRPEAKEEFLSIFNANKQFIAGFEGCKSLQILNEKSAGAEPAEGRPEVFFTISVWESEEHLNRYRDSKLFEEVWGKTKMMFAEKPEAWTTEVVK
jgi:heme oxygenase (mycobilin-producing)